KIHLADPPQGDDCATNAAGTIHSSRKSTTAVTRKSCPQEKRSTPHALRHREDTASNSLQARQSSPPSASAAGRAATLPMAEEMSVSSESKSPAAANLQSPRSATLSVAHRATAPHAGARPQTPPVAYP